MLGLGQMAIGGGGAGGAAGRNFSASVEGNLLSWQGASDGNLVITQPDNTTVTPTSNSDGSGELTINQSGTYLLRFTSDLSLDAQLVTFVVETDGNTITYEGAEQTDSDFNVQVENQTITYNQG